MRSNKALLLAPALSLIVLCAGVFLGSSGFFLFNADPHITAIVWDLRLPRTLLAFIVGGALAISGAVFQSALKNQLASPYIMGVSSGASLGAALVMTGLLGSLSALPFGLRAFVLPITGFVFGLGTVFVVIAFSLRMDKSLSNNTIILFGMVFSLFINAILVTLLSLFKEELKSLLVWQMGSFSLKGWNQVIIMLPFLVIGSLGILRYTRELDILSFGQDQAQSLGIDAKKVRKQLFMFAALITGAAVALCGAIGFVDLIAPHAARRIAGPSHRRLIPLAFCAGGILMVAADIIARIALRHSELPVGAVTALIGVPFFIFVYFRKK